MMLCPKCKIEMRNCEDSRGNWVAKCRNPRCNNYDCTVEVIMRNKAALAENEEQEIMNEEK